MLIEEAEKIHSYRKINYKISFIFLALLAVMIYLFFALESVEAKPKEISLVVNGLITKQITTHQTVGDFVKEIYPNQEKLLSVFPSEDIEICAKDTIFIKTEPADMDKIVGINMITAEKKAKEAEEPIPKSPTYNGTATWYHYGDTPSTASTQFPKGTTLRVIAVNSGKMVDVIVNDYGPEAWTGVSLDLNSIAFSKLAPLGAGKIPIKYYII